MGLRNPPCVTRTSAPPNLAPARKTTPARGGQNCFGRTETGTPLPHSRPSSTSGGGSRQAPNDVGQHAINQQQLRAGRWGTAAQYERPQSTPLALGTRLSPLLEGLGPPSARPRPGPDGSRPRRTNTARTTSRPVTRISRNTGDLPPTPYHVLGTRRTQLSTRTTPSPDTAGSTGESGDSDTTAKARPRRD
jgi:hypothetical protein